MISQALIITGMKVQFGRDTFKVGTFVPLLSAWELWKGDELALVVRDKVLANMATSIRFPGPAA